MPPSEAESELILNERPGDTATKVEEVVVAKGSLGGAAPVIERWTAAGGADETASGVATHQCAHGPAHEIDLLHVDEFEAAGVGTELRHSVDDGGDARVHGRSADAAKDRLARATGAVFIEENSWRMNGGVFDRAHSSGVEKGGITDRGTERQVEQIPFELWRGRLHHLQFPHLTRHRDGNGASVGLISVGLGAQERGEEKANRKAEIRHSSAL